MLAAGARSRKRRIFDLLRLARGDRSRLVDRASDGAAHRDRRRGVRAGTKSDDRRLDRLREQPYRKPRLVVGLPRGAESLARGAVRRRALGEYRRGEVVVRRGRRHRGGASPDRDARAAAARGSDDLGRHWERVAHFTDATAVRRIVIHPADPQTLYVCVEGGALRKSTDGGRAWRPLSYEDATYLAVGRNPAKLIVAGRSGLAISDDGGETWTQVNTVPGIGSFFLDPRDENVLYLAYGGSIVRSDDAGATWTELRNGLPDDVRGTVGGFSMFRWTRTAGLYVATADGDAYSSEERGTEWEVMARGLPPVYRSSVSS